MNKLLLAIAIIFAGGFADAQSYQPKSKLADFYKEANGNMIMILQVDNNYSAFDLRDEIPILARNPKDSIIAFLIVTVHSQCKHYLLVSPFWILLLVEAARRCLTQSVSKHASAVLLQWVKEKAQEEDIQRLGKSKSHVALALPVTKPSF